MGEEMRYCYLITILLVLASTGVAQENAPKPRVSDVPLTTEQIAVYRAVLRDYLNGSDGALNLAKITEPIDESDGTCFRGMDADAMKTSASVVHVIDPTVIANTRIVLVDPDQQPKTVRENDPDNLIRKGLTGQKVTDEQVAQSVRAAISSGLFELSEIVFDKDIVMLW
jgi:hypothetical protein